VRVSDLTSASKGLTIFFTKSWMYPETESGINITAWSNTLSKQWKLWQSVARVINMNQVPLDPVDQTKYTYSTNSSRTKYELLGYTENTNLVSVVPQSFAEDYSQRWVNLVGDELGVILNGDNSLPSGDVETSTGSKTYKVLFDGNTQTEGSGNLVFSQIYNMRDDLLKNKELASLDDSLVGYWDMETLMGDLLKDWSKYENHGTCYNNASSWACWVVWAKFVSRDGKNEKMMSFDGVDDRINIWIWKISQLPMNDFTVVSVINTTQNIQQRCIISTSWDGVAWFRYGFWDWDTSSYILYGGYWEWNIWKIKVNDGQNHILVARYLLNNRVDAFVDGSYVGMQNITWMWFNAALKSSQYFHIGTMKGYYSSNYIKWLIDEVRIYNRALSDSEIKALYSATK